MLRPAGQARLDDADHFEHDLAMSGPRLHFPMPDWRAHPYRIWTERVVLQGGYEPHTHALTEMVVFAGGSGRHVIDDASFDLAPGDVVSIKPGTVHEFAGCRALAHWNVGYTPDMLGLCGPEIRRIPGFQTMFVLGLDPRSAPRPLCRARLDRSDLARVVAILEAIRREQERRGPGHEALHRAWFIELVVLVSRAADPSRDREAIGRAALAASWLEEHHAEAVTLEDLAGHCGVSVRHLTRLFRAHYRTSPVDYLLRLRVAHAASLLVHGDRSITEIAHASGFGDSNYLARQFRRVMGCSPREHRRRTADRSASPMAPLASDHHP